ncbi:hypothetical protein [Pelomonas sp. KK5]|uniref:hypothetical protein n=1 Tax=Pelomonas sp. KK5 TaxID=1855730 RepID=UPI00097BB066|nr:hypothetical protein [Pelomonas sp. KK5]
MQPPLITRHDLERRHAALADMRQYLAGQEQSFEQQRAQVQAFAGRYLSRLGPLYRELGTIEQQLNATTAALIEMLRSHGLPAPEAQPAPTPNQQLAHALHRANFEPLPPAPALPPVPLGADIAQWAPPSLKALYRRAAMRIHPDRAGRADAAELARREQQMMALNAAHAAGERWRIEAMLLAAGEAPAVVTGGNAEALRNWLAHCEHLVQARLRIVNEALAGLATQAMHRLWRSVSQAEARGQDLLAAKAEQLRLEIDERRKELYIGQRLKPESTLARAFLHRRQQSASTTPQRVAAAQAST